MKRGNVWWVAFDPAQGSEIRKTRPAVIVSNDIANKFLDRLVVIPLSGNTKNLYIGEALITINNTPNKAMADQIRGVDKSRLSNKLGTLSEADMSAIEGAIRAQLALQ